MDDPYQAAYWDRVAGEKAFSHPLDEQLFERYVPRALPILDLGCGYGRSLARLHELGYTNLVGVDTSAAMIERGQREYPHLDLRPVDGDGLPFGEARFGLVLMLAVLTSIPADDLQREVLAHVRRVLGPEGLVFISDLWLQDDERNVERYADSREQQANYGIFEHPEGAVFRHHDRAWFDSLLARDWHELSLSDLELVSMNGNQLRGFQFLGRKLKARNERSARPIG